jgi:putative ABC transport system ATP-binding protein
MSCPVFLHSVSCQRPALGSISVSHLQLTRGSFTALLGAPSDGGLLLWKILGLLEQPDSGQVSVCGEPVTGLPSPRVEQIRNRHCGFVFESPFLLPSLSLIENIAMPLFKLGHLAPQEARTRTEELLDFVELRHLAQSAIHKLSAAEQWTASLARALSLQPSLLLIEYPEKQLPPEFLPAAACLLARACQHWDLATVATAVQPLPGATALCFPPRESNPCPAS